MEHRGVDPSQASSQPNFVFASTEDAVMPDAPPEASGFGTTRMIENLHGVPDREDKLPKRARIDSNAAISKFSSSSGLLASRLKEQASDTFTQYERPILMSENQFEISPANQGSVVDLTSGRLYSETIPAEY